jgi:hypothetical protein
VTGLMVAMGPRCLTLLWLLSSAEVFATAKRIEWGVSSVFPSQKGQVRQERVARFPCAVSPDLSRSYLS